MGVRACMQVHTRKMRGQTLYPVTGYRIAGTVQGFLQNEHLPFFQWPLRGALFPLKALGIVNRWDTSELKQRGPSS